MPEPPPRRPVSAEVRAGTFVGVFGVRGELKLAATRIGSDALRPGLAARVRLTGGEWAEVAIASVREHQGRPLVLLAGIGDATAAERFVRGEVTIARDDAPLGPGEYFDEDLIGCRVIDAAGTDRGPVLEVAHYPAQDLLVVGERRALLPLVRAFVTAIDVAGRTIRVDVPPGLLDGDAEEA